MYEAPLYFIMAELENDQWEIFCQEYVVDFNGTQAAIKAGYTPKSARVQANRLLTNDNIQRRIKELTQKKVERIEYTQDDVMRDLLEVKNRCMQKVPVMYYDKVDKEYKQEQDDLGRDVWKFDSQGANSALDKLAKHTGFYELDNKQRNVIPQIVVASEEDKKLIEDI